MTVHRLSSTPVKGFAMRWHEEAVVTPLGMADDRIFALVDTARNRVLRTVEMPGSVAWQADWDGEKLLFQPPEGQEPSPIFFDMSATGYAVSSPTAYDYWGRTITASVIEGPEVGEAVAALERAMWGHPDGSRRGASRRPVTGRLALARLVDPAHLVFGPPLTAILLSEVDELAARCGRPGIREELDRFRANVVIDDREFPCRGEDLVGGVLCLGSVLVDVLEPIERCAVIERSPRQGVGDVGPSLLAALAEGRRGRDGITFGVGLRPRGDGVLRRHDGVDILQ